LYRPQCIFQYSRHAGCSPSCCECLAVYIPFHTQVQAIFDGSMAKAIGTRQGIMARRFKIAI
jgi:hypothetical protein